MTNSNRDWASVISGFGESGNSGISAMNNSSESKRDAKEMKRKTLSSILSGALKRRQGINRAGQDYSNDMNDYQSQAIQQVARGFVNALEGSTKG